MSSRNHAVTMLLANLREELIAAPRESRAEEHVDKMRLEYQLLVLTASEPRRTPQRIVAPRVTLVGIPARVRRAALARPRRLAAVLAAVCVLCGNLGLNPAAALPGAVRQITDRITDAIVNTFGVPDATHSLSVAGPIRGVTKSHAPPDSIAPLGSASRAGSPTRAAPTSAAPDVAPLSAGPSEPPTTGPREPSGGPLPSEPPTTTTRPPQTTGLPGLPADWKPRAIDAARTQLQACAQIDSLAPTGCPQVAVIGDNATPASVQWTLLNQPLAGATGIARAADGSGDPAIGAVISVYGQFQMDATYTVGDETQPHSAYSAGVAEATMTWDGSSMQNVSFTSGSVHDQLPAGVQVPEFERPAEASDSVVLAALKLGFDSWASGASGTLVADPLQGAVVTFDPADGSFTASGIYIMTPPDGGDPVGHPYTATFVYVNNTVLLITLAGLV